MFGDSCSSLRISKAFTPCSLRFLQFPFGSKDLVAYICKSAGNITASSCSFSLDSHDHVLVLGQADAGAFKRLVKSLVKGLSNTRHSPVDFISGPKLISAPRIFSKENTGILTAI